MLTRQRLPELSLNPHEPLLLTGLVFCAGLTRVIPIRASACFVSHTKQEEFRATGCLRRVAQFLQVSSPG